ncbi:holo-ACP synthase [Mitsuokella sp.]|uniref:holo-ACP synthase n=1 Tax=Mitsuokella TaxID=52225 RepID=UPI0029E356D3|nr:holo-ACP synthase [Mitsuokella sp.]MDD6382236.1 holo-ACP synthase [Selenomonadaceae bacterium]MDY4473944.1 holo-ACP synthase [Mitsuokella sp.]
MIRGIGTDIVEIARIRQAVAKERFVVRVYTEGERAYCEGRGVQAAASFAARFSGKEAVLKAFGTGLRGGTLRDVEILPDAQGAPRVNLHGYFAELARQRGIKEIWLSLSHTGAYAVAQCVMEG